MGFRLTAANVKLRDLEAIKRVDPSYMLPEDVAAGHISQVRWDHHSSNRYRRE